MKRNGALIGLCVALIFILFTSCGTDSFEGEYSYDGRGPAGITILDNGTVELMFNGYAVVEYEKKGNHLEVLEKDIYSTFENPITGVHFELTEEDNLRYILYEGEEVYDQTDFTRIPGSDGESGEISVLWLTIKSLFLGLLIFAVVFIGMFFLFQWWARRNSTT